MDPIPVFQVLIVYLGFSCSSFIDFLLCPTVYANRNLAPLSPYLNFDPSYLQTTQPEFIFPEGASRQRGRFELAFSTIGGCCMVGGALGGVAGLYQGIKDTAIAGHTGKLRRTQ